MEANDALIFCSYMQPLKQKCKLCRDPDQQENASFPAVPPSCFEDCYLKDFEGHCIMKTHVWAIHHCLSSMKSLKKTYSIEICNTTELSKAADDAYLICGYLNPECVSQEIRNWNSEYPLDPVISSLGIKNKTIYHQWYYLFLLLVVFTLQDFYLTQLISCKPKDCG